jgi:DNA polymerase I-like protein with 3'-5' exonuclease and polymerase domains
VKLASQIYWAGLDSWLEQINGKPHSLASICCRLNLPLDKTKQKSSWGWGDLEGGKLSNAQINYAAKDAEVVLEVGGILMPLLQEIGAANSYLIECAASPGFAQMSHFGMPANKSKSSAIASAYKSACADLIKRLNSSFPEAVPHLFSPKKLTAAINAKFKLNLADSNAEQLAERWSIPEIRLISVIKTAKTYCDYVGSLEEKTDENGFVHPEFAQITRLGFGRAAARNPNVQNPPNPANFPAELAEYELPPIRSAFAPPPGKALIACDLSKIHTRIACEASQDPHLKAIFNSQSQNIFAPISAKIARIQGMDAGWNEGNLTRWKQDKSHPNHHPAASLYALAKTVHYASLNLSGNARIRSIIGLAGNHREIALEEARLLVGAWRQTYPVLARFQRELTDRASNCLPRVLGISSIAAKSRFGLGYVRCITGRGTYLPKWPNNNSRQPSVRGPDACAASWTLAEADIVKLAVGLCVERFDANPDWEAHLANVCHDELLAVCAIDRALDVANCLLECTNAAVGTFIKSIAVSETVQPGQLICSDWSQK